MKVSKRVQGAAPAGEHEGCPLENFFFFFFFFSKAEQRESDA